MKKKDLERKLRALAWRLLRQGGAHEVWTNGSETEVIPRHKEVHDLLAQKILRTARKFPGAGR